MIITMPRKSRLKLPPLKIGGGETLGERLARIRQEKGYTQNELAEKVGTIQVLVSDYERGKLRLNAEMAIRFAKALGVSTDALLGVKKTTSNSDKPGRRLLRRIEQIGKLPAHQQSALLKTIDIFLRGAQIQQP